MTTKLRQFAFPLVAACSAVSKEIVPLVFNLGYDKSVTYPSSLPENVPRAPIVYPMLLGHVLTHVVAAMCAACGKTRVHKSSLAIKDEYDVSPNPSQCAFLKLRHVLWLIHQQFLI